MNPKERSGSNIIGRACRKRQACNPKHNIMSIKNKITEDYKYFVTLTVVDWVDIFTRPIYRHIILYALEYCQKNKGLIIYAWCIMSNHLHLIIEAKEGYNLSDILRDFKKFTSKEILKTIKEYPESRRKWLLNRFEYAGKFNNKIKNYKFWKDGNEAKEIDTGKFLGEKLDYVHHNPVYAEIVDSAEEYRYSSARDYCGHKGLINIEIID